MILGVIVAIVIIIGILYFTCGRLGFILNLIIYTLLSSSMQLIFPSLRAEETSQIMYVVFRLLLGFIMIKRLFIIYERIGNPIAFFITGFILESFFTFALCKVVSNIYFKAFVGAYVVFSVILLFRGSYYNELLNSNLWTTGNQMTPEGRIEINEVKAKRNLFWGNWLNK